MTDHFDEILVSALRARPEPAAHMDLAAEAMRRALAREAHAADLARLSRWTQLSRVAAGILIVIVAVAGYTLWPTAATSTTETMASTSTSLSSTSSYTMDPGIIGAAIFVAALVVVTIGSLFHVDRAAPAFVHPV